MKKKWYKSKVFVITGASGGIGSAVCRLFAPLGMRMYLLDLPGPALDNLTDELRELGAEHVESITFDVTNQAQINSGIKIIGDKEKYIDILFNNAGIGNKASITNYGTFEEYRRLMSVNVDGMWLTLQAALPYIGRPAPTKKNQDRREGQLIFSSSAAGKTGAPNMAAYSMSKHAIVALADSIRLEYLIQNHNIQVITVCSAPARTKFYDGADDLKEWVNKYEKRGFLFKFVEPEDVAKRIMKASRKYKREIMVPRWWWLLPFLNTISHRTVGKMLMKIEKD